MRKFSKEIKVNDYSRIRYDINDGYIPMHTIILFDEKDYKKTISFSVWDDYNFRYWSDNKDYDEYKNTKSELYIFKKENPLYIPLLHLLNGEKELIIDDDDTAELNKKYMKVFLDNDNIGINFINELSKDDETSMERFSVFIKNIGFDLRSKIDCQRKDTKERLHFFFKETYKLFNEEYHQTTIEEYLINNNLLTREESKKYVKKLNINESKN